MKILFGAIGILVGIFALGQIIGSLCAKLSVWGRKESGELKDNSFEVRMAKQLTLSTLVWSAILAVIIVLVCLVFSKHKAAFFIGLAISLIITLLNSGNYVREFYKNVEKEVDRVIDNMNNGDSLL